MEQLNLFMESENKDEVINKVTRKNERKGASKRKSNVLSYRDYPVSIEYGQKDWTMVSALREILANMLDLKCEYSYRWENGFGYMEDMGPGLPMKGFIFGASSKDGDDTSIGQFGEGLKLAFITSLRNDRKFEISTVGYGATLEKVYSKEEDVTLMRVNYNDDSRKIGTLMKVECTQEEWNEALGLFLAFKEGYQKVDNNLFLPGGFISILGLITENMSNLVFSYDLSDKSVINRDRNAIKSRGLKENMTKILSSLKTQRAIKMYFESMDENPEAEEYKLFLQPKNKELWMQAIKRLYGDKVCYSTNIQNDLKAQTKGYHIIRNITKPLVKTLKYIGLESSKEVSSDIKGNVGFLEKNKIKFTMSEDYCSDWTFVDAGREFLANALDVSGKDIKRYYKDGFYYIEDNGDGLTKDDFVLGNSVNKGKTDIGKFGEGLKIASLVMTRQKREVEIITVGATYKPVIELNEEFSVNLFSINYEKNKRKKGTIIKFKATEEEIASIENLFIAFKDNYKAIECSDLDIILDNDEEGVIYVNGLKSANVNTLLSYNIKDKTLVNTRDRNGVDTDKLSYYLTSAINNIKDEQVIEKFLTGWMDNIHKYEYKLILNPIHSSEFEKVAKRIFTKHCIQGMDMMSNATVKLAGYTLLNNIPPYVREILILCGIPTAEQLALEYNAGISMENRFVTVISPNYASHWGVVDAARELISNAIDTGAEFDVTFDNNKCVIEDKGDGIKKKNLIFGEGEKDTKDSKIGCFGEGLKMATLVLSREKRDIIIETVGYNLIPKIEFDSDFGVELLVFYMKENDREVGTKITFKSTKTDVISYRKMFLVFNDVFKKQGENIYSPGGTIFVNGVAVETGVSSEFSYNIVTRRIKDIMGRDRQNLDYDMKVDYLGDIWSSIKDKDLINKYIRAVLSGKYEEIFADRVSLYGRMKTIWREVAQEVFPKSCLPSLNPHANMVAEDEEFRVLSDIGYKLRCLLEAMNFPTAEKVVALRGDEDVAKKVVEYESLTDEEKEKYDRMMNAIILEYGDVYKNKIIVCEEFTRYEHSKVLGLYVPEYDNCYVLRELLSKNHSMAECIGVVAHEICHRESEALDMTRAFENALTSKIGQLLCKVYNL